MKILLVSFLAIASIASVALVKSKSKTSNNIKSVISEKIKPTTPGYNFVAVAKNKASEIKKYAAENNYNTENCFLIDMKIPSGKARFFVYDFKEDTIVQQGLVAHGGGSETATNKLQFNNVVGGGASSLGKYKIGINYNGTFGLAYKLHGLDASNNKAFQRFVVLHAHECVPSVNVFPMEICTSLGCPTVNQDYLQTLKSYISKADKPILLCIYY